VFDNWVVDNHWAIRYKRQAVRRVFHQATPYSGNPILSGDQPSHLWAARDPESGKFRIYYQANSRRDRKPGESGGQYTTLIAYAESDDGLKWVRPDLKLFPWHQAQPNNVVVARVEEPRTQTSAPVLLEVPQKDRRGFRWLMLYRAKGRGVRDFSGIRIIGSQDGVHWDADSDTRIAHLHSDCHNTISYDPRQKRYVMFCRSKHIYRAFGDEMIDTGASRRVARMTSPTLWTDWLDGQAPQTVMIPDEIDSDTHFNFFYGMPTVYRYGVYWGGLQPFRMNDFVHTELAVSRDGQRFERFAGRLPVIPYGDDGEWDDTMIFACPAWIEVGDEWWLYYSGWDGPHGTPERTGGIGLARIRREGFVSLRGPRDGGVVCTRTLEWPGGDLVINADASAGEAKVRVSDARRQPINGFDYDECETFSGNSVTHPVTWAGKSLNALRGQVIRLEFYLDDADLYSFRAAPVQNGTSGDESSSNGSSSNSSSSSFSSSSRSGCSGSPG
jgi:hypothetical protein